MLFSHWLFLFKNLRFSINSYEFLIRLSLRFTPEVFILCKLCGSSVPVAVNCDIPFIANNSPFSQGYILYF